MTCMELGLSLAAITIISFELTVLRSKDLIRLSN